MMALFSYLFLAGLFLLIESWDINNKMWPRVYPVKNHSIQKKES
uniref:Uncharacterized protein n=1 Tax=Utricularia reniformis TaxID=192314 RepID=A0A1Y0B1S0_9LAMI|nr:hypothetical protein AEK19_MT1093 [Utricularia reniformis]ART31313.1 hypothetical protein AEK19_MT1093 [Utricularia reniformis]